MADDRYYTPRYVTEALLKREGFVGHVLEPASGERHIVEVLRDWGWGLEDPTTQDRPTVLWFDKAGDVGYDFLKDWTSPVPNIITNPPFSELMPFIGHCLDLAERKVALLCPLRRGNYYDDYWIRPDFQVKSVFLLTKQPKFYRPEGLIDKGQRAALAWIVWQRGFKGRAEFDFVTEVDKIEPVKQVRCSCGWSHHPSSVCCPSCGAFPGGFSMAEAEVKKGKVGPGWRYCSECDHSTKGPRSEKCGKCGTAFTKGKKAVATATQSKATSDRILANLDRTGQPSNQELAIEFAKRLGGISEAKEALADLEATKRMFADLPD